jgi:hypothetical protein
VLMTPPPASRARRFGRHAAKSATPHAKRGEEGLLSSSSLLKNLPVFQD